MAELGYLPAERKKVVRQLMVLNYAPDCPVRMAESLFVSIESAADEHNKYQTRFKEYLQMKALDFGMLRLPEDVYKRQAMWTTLLIYYGGCALGVFGMAKVVEHLP